MHNGYGEQPDRTGIRTAASVMDFVGVMCCTLLILALMMLAVALFSWLKGDLATTFSGIGQNIGDAMTGGGINGL